MHKTNVLYSIPCTTCVAVYIGQTSRSLATHLKEHKTIVKHARTETFTVTFGRMQTSILDKEMNVHQRESWHISKQHAFNRELRSFSPTDAAFLTFNFTSVFSLVLKIQFIACCLLFNLCKMVIFSFMVTQILVITSCILYLCCTCE